MLTLLCQKRHMRLLSVNYCINVSSHDSSTDNIVGRLFLV